MSTYQKKKRKISGEPRFWDISNRIQVPVCLIQRRESMGFITFLSSSSACKLWPQVLKFPFLLSVWYYHLLTKRKTLIVLKLFKDGRTVSEHEVISPPLAVSINKLGVVQHTYWHIKDAWHSITVQHTKSAHGIVHQWYLPAQNNTVQQDTNNWTILQLWFSQNGRQICLYMGYKM